jgi:hypothetical protein
MDTKVLSSINGLWNQAKSAPSKTRAHFSIEDSSAAEFQPQQHYFQVIVNEMHLAESRNWWTKYLPVTIVASKHIYNVSQDEVGPMVVGPAVFREFIDDISSKAIIRNAPVTNMHPYQGGAISLTILLNKVSISNNVDKVLSVLENFTGVINPVTSVIPFSSYLKVAGKVMDGVETLFNLPETQPLLAYRWTINPDIGQAFKPVYLVLIDIAEDDPNFHRQWFTVKDDRLYYGPDPTSAKPYRDNDFILLKVAQGTHRSDERLLSFYPIWQEIQKTAQVTVKDESQDPMLQEHYWKEIDNQWRTLLRAMRTSPDLTKADFTTFQTRYFNDLKGIRDDAMGRAPRKAAGSLAALPPEEAELTQLADQFSLLIKS